MRKTRWIQGAAVAGAAVLLVAACGGSGGGGTTASGGSGSTGASAAPKGPITIGAVVDLTKNMAPFDAPAIASAKIEIAKINAQGGVDGRKLKLMVQNDQLDPQKTKQDAVQMLSKGADIGWVTCDVDYATPAVQEFLNAGKLTVAPCTGTDEMSPLRFGQKGKLAFSFGNAAQDEGAAAAEYAYNTQHWKSAVVVTDNLLRYFKDVCKAFTLRFQSLGGKIVAQESFTQGDKTINNVASRVNGEKSDAIAFCTSFGGDQPAFVDALRSVGNTTPIINGWASDGAYWWSKNPQVTNFYFLTFASAFGNDPNSAVTQLENELAKAGAKPQTGGFITGAATIQGIVEAIKRNNGSTDGAALASTMEKFDNVPTISGPISFSPQLHTVFGRPYRVIEVDHNKAKFLGLQKASSPAKIH
jgi:branched-chain amino acid transport system substrate-binding protein